MALVSMTQDGSLTQIISLKRCTAQILDGIKSQYYYAHLGTLYRANAVKQGKH
jgi:hypothetical protein